MFGINAILAREKIVCGGGIILKVLPAKSCRISLGLTMTGQIDSKAKNTIGSKSMSHLKISILDTPPALKKDDRRISLPRLFGIKQASRKPPTPTLYFHLFFAP